MSFLQTFPYFFFSLILFVVALICLATCTRYRKPIILCGLLAAPAGFLEIFFVPNYWNPVRLFDFFVGVEDFIFSFSVGIIACTLAFSPYWRRFSWDIHPSTILKRFAFVYPLFVASLAILQYSGLNVMAAALLSMLGVALVLNNSMKELWPVSAVGALGFSLFYFILMKAGFALWPHWLQQWSFGNLSGYHGLGVPLEEIAWAFLYGAIHPCAIGYILDFKIKSGGPAVARSGKSYGLLGPAASANSKDAAG